MMPNEARAKYLVNSLDSSVRAVEYMLKGLDKNAAVWDFTASADRFTLREVIAHMADFDPIWLMRVKRAVEQDTPFLASVDENAMAVEHDYAHCDPIAKLAEWRAGRVAFTAYLRGLTDAQWGRVAQREGIGLLTVEEQAHLVLGHDMYHVAQVAEWIAVS